ncbi:hypothetical protein SLS55_010523 [Diplodia seriata]|uniref:Hypervirulence associated protein TUDOR domain-containing protein n=1 Tax=Diplodia seriata TaxID=420778 RepID=A0A0G2DZS2_9PEZI|nr:putative conserved hypothetical protein [Diplodia seriata]
MPRYEVDQKVLYKAIGGPDSNTPVSHGTIMSVITSDARMAGHNVKASEDDPRYEIKNDNTGKKSAIFETNIIRVIKP